MSCYNYNKFFFLALQFFFTNTTTVLYVAKENGEIEKPKNEADGKILHRTQSIFIRNLAPNITKQEVEAVSIVPRPQMRPKAADSGDLW